MWWVFRSIAERQVTKIGLSLLKLIYKLRPSLLCSVYFNWDLFVNFQAASATNFMVWQVTHHEYEVETSNGRTITKRRKRTVMFGVCIIFATWSWDNQLTCIISRHASILRYACQRDCLLAEEAASICILLLVFFFFC